MEKIATVYHWKKLIAGCVFGNVLVYYDFILYGYFSHIIAKLFFPTTSQFVSLLLTFSVFASGCLMRPIGAMVFGHIGDRYGRKIALLVSITCLTLFTTLMGLIPSYQMIGFWAPICLLLCRLLQGAAISGEEMGAVIYLAENAPLSKRAFVSSIISSSVYFGLLVGSVIAFITLSLVPSDSIATWGWRVPFLFSLVLGIIALIIRSQQADTLEFTKLKVEHALLKNPVTILFKQHYRALIYVIFLCSSLAVAIYLLSVYIPTELNVSMGLDLKTSMLISSAGFFVLSSLILVVGMLTDKIGSRWPLIISSVGFIILAYPIFILLSQKSISLILLADFMMVFFLSLTAGSLLPILVNIFPAQVRSAGGNIAFNISMTLFGSTAPIIALCLVKLFHSATAPASYLMFAAVLTLSCLLIFKSIKQPTN
jgi:MHS family proline/betaine transporter-like MFS transporter